MSVTKTMEEIRLADEQAKASKAAAAKEASNEASELRNQLINEFENDTGDVISNTNMSSHIF